MKGSYGVPYQGSKNQIAEFVVRNLPKAENLYDLFAGGCAVTHCAMKMGRFKNYYVNDLNPFGITIFKGALEGKYRDENRWISREDFERLKNTDAYVALCWSFCSNQEDYLYSKEIETWKKALHYARVFGDCSLLREFGIEGDGSRKYVKEHLEECKEKYKSCSVNDICGVSYETFVSIPHSNRNRRINSLSSKDKFNLYCSFKSYEDVEIRPNSVIYCDIPYEGTVGYAHIPDFDYEHFYHWCSVQNVPVIVSSYNLPNCFKRIASTMKMKMFSNKGTTGKVEEGLYVHREQIRRGIYKKSAFVEKYESRSLFV